jgi:hypothetical protein
MLQQMRDADGAVNALRSLASAKGLAA